MKINTKDVRQCLKAFDFKTLFYEHLGWDQHQARLDVPVDNSTVTLTAIAQKRGFVAFVCDSIPTRQVRLKIDHQVTKSAREHFVIYADEPAGQQVWHWVRRETGKPLASRDHRFDVSQSGALLIQRLERIAVSMEEEEKLTLPDMTGRGREAFDVDKVTKKFYERFKAEHAAFLKLITGFPPPIKKDGKPEPHPDLQWYTSLMLNRLMFVYFMQKKGFLDGDTDYLRHRLSMVQQAKGKDKFQSFYRYFLLRLFHDGLGKSLDDRKLEPAMEKLLGKIPFLNGGFFEVHKLEKDYPDIDIPDAAFDKLFDFFEYADKANGVRWDWHLDERTCRADNEINPDVVGYIFEKYINQKQMGAYYTKEDITEYISKNTIIPYLFDAANKKCAIAFKPDSALWRLLQDDPDRYIYPAVGHGITCDYDRVNHRDHKRLSEPLPLPPEIEAGVNDVSKRDGWNKTADPEYGLPTETWREVVARRQRCLDIREKLSKGEVQEINDLITLNLDIWQFARDAIVNAEGPELLRAFWRTLAGRMPEKSNEQAEPGITILDPTCGSGAFLFAALRILETLYSDCLERMERFVEEAEHAAPSTPEDEVRKLIAAGESATVEFKSSARWDIKESRHNPVLEEVIVKTVAGFMNTYGGTLLIGVSDNGTPLGLERDYRHTRKDNPSRDQFELWLTKRLMKDLGKDAKPCFHVDFASCDGADVCRVKVYRSAGPVFVEKNGQDILYVRDGNATNPRTKSSEILAYKERHWPAGQTVPQPPAPPSFNATTLKISANAKRAFEDFRKTLAQIGEHRGESYFILKSIIINNLFGVDIMEEAVEICKLRLFLKLVAQVEPDDSHPHYGLEPLPDIDFNIRAGNTLVGFASLDQVKQSMEGDMIKMLELPRIEEEAGIVDHAFQQFRRQQTEHGGKVTAEDKQNLRDKLAKLDDELDRYLASEYGVDTINKTAFLAWQHSHQPFHWLVEFYGIMTQGGFDVIIGNPPYVEYSKVRKEYQIKGYQTEECGNLYAQVMERSGILMRCGGGFGMIVPLSICSSERMASLRSWLLQTFPEQYVSNFEIFPSKLFDGAFQRVSIVIGTKNKAGQAFVSKLHRWYSIERATLIDKMIYTPAFITSKSSLFFKIQNSVNSRVLQKLLTGTESISRWCLPRSTKYFVFYQEATNYWAKATARIPYYKKNGAVTTPAHSRTFYLDSGDHAAACMALVNSSLFYVWYIGLSDGFHMNDSIVKSFPVMGRLLLDSCLLGLASRLENDIKINSFITTRNTKTDRIEIEAFKMSASKTLIDEIDRVLAQHYGFTDEELDFIINYDIKYRMGGAENGEGK